MDRLLACESRLSKDTNQLVVLCLLAGAHFLNFPMAKEAPDGEIWVQEILHWNIQIG